MLRLEHWPTDLDSKTRYRQTNCDLASRVRIRWINVQVFLLVPVIGQLFMSALSLSSGLPILHITSLVSLRLRSFPILETWFFVSLAIIFILFLMVALAPFAACAVVFYLLATTGVLSFIVMKSSLQIRVPGILSIPAKVSRVVD